MSYDINLEQNHEYASKWGLTDWYPDSEATLRAALESGEDFNTAWFGCKKEIRYGHITGTGDELEIRVNVHMDDLWEEDDLIYDALWEACRTEEMLPQDIIDSIRDSVIGEVDDHTVLSATLPRSSTFEEINRAIENLEYEAEANNHRMYLILCDVVKDHVQYMKENNIKFEED